MIQSTNNYKFYRYHNHNVRPDYSSQEYIDVVSIDPGIANFAICIERRYSNGVIQTIELSNTKIIHDSKNDITLYYKVNEHLNQFLNIFKSCHFILIEKQMSKNHKCTKLFQHLITYFMMVCATNRNVPYITELTSTFKSRQFGIKGLKRPELKRWGEEKAYELLTIRGDGYAIDVLNSYADNKKKIDDMTDTIIQSEAFFNSIGFRDTIQYNEAILREKIEEAKELEERRNENIYFLN